MGAATTTTRRKPGPRPVHPWVQRGLVEEERWHAAQACSRAWGTYAEHEPFLRQRQALLDARWQYVPRWGLWLHLRRDHGLNSSQIALAIGEPDRPLRDIPRHRTGPKSRGETTVAEAIRQIETAARLGRLGVEYADVDLGTVADRLDRQVRRVLRTQTGRPKTEAPLPVTEDLDPVEALPDGVSLEAPPTYRRGGGLVWDRLQLARGKEHELAQAAAGLADYLAGEPSAIATVLAQHPELALTPAELQALQAARQLAARDEPLDDERIARAASKDGLSAGQALTAWRSARRKVAAVVSRLAGIERPASEVEDGPCTSDSTWSNS